MEDYDLCRRALNKGYRLLYVPNAIVYHKVGGSRVHNLADVYQGYKTSIIYMKKRLPWWIFVFWFCLYATYVLIISPYKNRSELYRLPKSSYKMAVLLGLIKGLFNSRVRREDMEIVVNRGLFRRG